MKKILSISLLFGMSFLLTSCFEDIKKTFDGATVVEFNEAITRTPATGKTYPLIAVNNGAGVQITTKVNLVGLQRASESAIKYSIDKTNSTAVEGVHFKLNDNGSFAIKANDSFGLPAVEILKAPAQTGVTVNLIIQLDGNGSDILPSENYKKLGYAIKL